MPSALSESDYISRLRLKSNSSIIKLEPYSGYRTKTLHRHITCGHEWKVMPQALLLTNSPTYGCPKCGATRRGCSPQDESTYRKKLKKSSEGNLLLVGPYTNARTLALHKCLTCNSTRKYLPGNLVNNKTGCVVCAHDKGVFHRPTRMKLGNRIVTVQGYEPRAIELMLMHGWKPRDIRVRVAEGKPTIRYYLNKERTYYPDFYYKPKNLIVEVKSDYTLGLTRPEIFKQNCLKAQACVASGFNFLCLVIRPDGGRIKLPRTWYLMSLKELLALL